MQRSEMKEPAPLRPAGDPWSPFAAIPYSGDVELEADHYQNLEELKEACWLVDWPAVWPASLQDIQADCRTDAHGQAGTQPHLLAFDGPSGPDDPPPAGPLARTNGIVIEQEAA